MSVSYESLRISEVRTYNPDTGASLVKTYEGTPQQMTEVESHWATLNIVDNTPTGRGYRTMKRTIATHRAQLTVTIPDDQLYTDRWALDTETASVPLWWAPQVRSYSPTLSLFDLTVNDLHTSGFEGYMRRIMLMENSIAAMRAGQDPNQVILGMDLPLGTAYTAEDYALMFTYIKDGGFIEMKRPVLKRNRTVPYLVTRTVVVGPQNVYTTAALIDAYGLPDEAIALIDSVEVDLPTSYPHYIWGWKERRNDSDTVIGFARTNETRDWVFGNWSRITHTVFE